MLVEQTMANISIDNMQQRKQPNFFAKEMKNFIDETLSNSKAMHQKVKSSS